MTAHTFSSRRLQLTRLGLLLGMVLLIASQAGIAQQAEPERERLVLTAGRSMVLTTDFDIERLALTNPEVADAQVVEPRELLIDGISPGTIILILWGTGTRVQYDLVV